MIRIYAINSQAMLDREQRFTSALQAALDGGIDWFQLRDKRDHDTKRERTARLAQQLCRDAGVPLLINDDLALATTIGADGLHVGQGDAAVQLARRRLGPHALIGCSCHDRHELAAAASRDGASYVAFGRLFASRTKPEAPAADLDYVRQHIAKLPIPTCVIGGIRPENVHQAIGTGAHILAVVDSIFGAADIRLAVRRLRQAIDHASSINANAGVS